MSPEAITLVVAIVIAVIIIASLLFRRLPKRLKNDKFVVRWKEIQKYCADKTSWVEAITQADQLLDSALKKRKFKGKSMGERMVAAQRIFTDNDDLWFAHNLVKKVLSEPETKLKESDVKDAMVGFRQALRDIGALPSGEQRNS